jgi:hypothetical protein
MEYEQMRRYMRSAGHWLVAECLFDVYTNFIYFNQNQQLRDDYFTKLFIKHGKNYPPRSRRWRITSIMKLVQDADIYMCLDSILESKSSRKNFYETKNMATATKERFLERYGRSVPHTPA